MRDFEIAQLILQVAQTDTSRTEELHQTILHASAAEKSDTSSQPSNTVCSHIGSVSSFVHSSSLQVFHLRQTYTNRDVCVQSRPECAFKHHLRWMFTVYNTIINNFHNSIDVSIEY